MSDQQNQEIYEYYTYQVYAQDGQEVDTNFWEGVMGNSTSGGLGLELGASSGAPEEQNRQADGGDPTSSATANLGPSILDHRESFDNSFLQGENSMGTAISPPPPPTTGSRKRKTRSPINPQDPNDPRTRFAKEPGSPRTEAARRRNAAAVRRFREKEALEKMKRPDILDEQYRQEHQTKEDVLEGTWGDVGDKGLVGEAPECWDEYMEAVRVLRRMGKEDEEAKKARGLATAEMMIVKSALARKQGN